MDFQQADNCNKRRDDTGRDGESRTFAAFTPATAKRFSSFLNQLDNLMKTTGFFIGTANVYTTDDLVGQLKVGQLILNGDNTPCVVLLY